MLESNTILSLLEAVGKKGKNNILVVSHGTPDGLLLSVGEDRKLYPWMRMALLLHMAVIKSYYKEAQAKDQEPKVFVRRPDLENWYKVYAATHPDHGFNFLKKDQQESALGSLKGSITSAGLARLTHDVEAIEENTSIEQRSKKLEATLKSVKAEVEKKMAWMLANLAMRDEEVERYIEALKAVHSLKVQRVEVRGCNVGKSLPTMRVLCMFLGAGELRAPDVADYFAEIAPDVNPNASGFSKRTKVDKEALSPSALQRLPGFNRKTMLPAGWRFEVAGLGAHRDELYFNESYGKKENKMIAESIDVVRKFISTRMGVPQRGLESIQALEGFPAQFLETTPPYFPLEEEFGKHLKSVESQFKVSLSNRKIEGLKP